jgi:hypothetical protein
VNVILFSTTRRILPPRSIFAFNISRPQLIEASTDIPPTPTLEKVDYLSFGYTEGSARTVSAMASPSTKDASPVPELPMLKRVGSGGSDSSSELGAEVGPAPSPLDFGSGYQVTTPSIATIVSPGSYGMSLTSPSPHLFDGLSAPPLSRATSAGAWSPSLEAASTPGAARIADDYLRPLSAATSVYSQVDSFSLTGRDSLTEEYARLYRSDTVALNRTGETSGSRGAENGQGGSFV